MKPKVKICGITNIKDALTAVWCGADALGFVFFKESNRYISPQRAKQIIQRLAPWIVKVGVFVNEKIPSVNKIAQYCKLDFVQLHGDEDATYLRKLKSLRLIKAVRLKDKASFKNLDRLPCELVLFDTYSRNEFGGTGIKFDWRLAKLIKRIKKPYIVSGGLNTFNVGRAVKKFSPYAVDVSSGVEKLAGKKDAKLIKEFIQNAKR